MKINLKMLTVAAVGLSVSMLSAKTCTWIGSSGNWTDTTKWQDGVVPEDGDDVVFLRQDNVKMIRSGSLGA